MSAKHKSAPSVPGAEMFENLGKALEEAAEQGRRMLESGAHAWREETQTFVERLSADAAETYGRLTACKTPLEVLQVEQAWLAARAKAYMEASSRVIHAMAAPPTEGDGAGKPQGTSTAAPAKAPPRRSAKARSASASR